MRTLLFVFASAAVVVAWGVNQIADAQLRAELASLRSGNAELATARREHARLQELQSEASRRAAKLSAAAQAPVPVVKMAAPVPNALVVGEWVAPNAWQNRGRVTPAATIETALWAAAGGDLAALQGLLHLDETLRAKAEALHARLPASARVTYPSAEHLLAAFATKSLPLGDAQLVWSHQATADEAFACLFVKNPEHAPAPPLPESPLPATREAAIAHAAALKEARLKDKRPPMAAASQATRALYLVLRRTDTGWRFVVSPNALDRIAKELAGAPGP